MFDGLKDKLARFLGGQHRRQSRAMLSNYVPYPQRSKRHQVEFRKNEQAIRQGQIPNRLDEFAKLIPGESFVEVGSADGTLSLHLGRNGKKVFGVELTEYRHQKALELKEAWLNRGEDVSQVNFICGDSRQAGPYLDQVETLVLSRTLYHLRADAEPLIARAKQSDALKNIAILGNRVKERVYLEGGNIRGLEKKYLALASLQGMSDLLTQNGFVIELGIESTDETDAVVIASKD